MAHTPPPLVALWAAAAENTVKSIRRSLGAHRSSEMAMRRLLNQDLVSRDWVAGLIAADFA
jgi:hypothetical protein